MWEYFDQIWLTAAWKCEQTTSQLSTRFDSDPEPEISGMKIPQNFFHFPTSLHKEADWENRFSGPSKHWN